MAFLQTSAQDMPGLINAIRDFAVVNGWNLKYDNQALLQIGLRKDACRVGIGANLTSSKDLAYKWIEVDKINNVNVPVEWIRMGLATGLDADGTYFTNPGAGNVSNDCPLVDSLTPPYSNIFMFCPPDGSYIWVVIQNDPHRYVTLGFGNVDNKGSGLPGCAFSVGCKYTFVPNHWDITDNYYGPNNIQSSRHAFFFDNYGEDVFDLYIADGVLDKTYWPTLATPAVVKRMFGTMDRFTGRGPFFDYSTRTRLMDIGPYCSNQTTTGGIALYSFPVLYYGDRAMAYHGDLPGIRYVNISNLEPQDVITTGQDEWMVFPFIRKGSFANTNYGNTPLPDPNTQHYGYAFKKDN